MVMSMTSTVVTLTLGFLGGNTSAEMIKSSFQRRKAKSDVMSNFINEWSKIYETTRENTLSEWDANSMGIKGSIDELVQVNNLFKDLRVACMRVHAIAGIDAGQEADYAFESLRSNLLHDTPCSYSRLEPIFNRAAGRLSLRERLVSWYHQLQVLVGKSEFQIHKIQ